MFKYDDPWIWNVNYEKLFWIGILENLIYFGHIVHQYSKLKYQKNTKWNHEINFRWS